jgi:hypothetical protein
MDNIWFVAAFRAEESEESPGAWRRVRNSEIASGTMPTSGGGFCQRFRCGEQLKVGRVNEIGFEKHPITHP